MARKRTLAFKPTSFLTTTEPGRTSQVYRNKEPIYSQGDRADSVFYVEGGMVKLMAESKRGKKAVIAILKRGDFFGEACLGWGSLRVSTAISLGQSTVTRLKKKLLVRMIRYEPMFTALFIASLISRIEHVKEDLEDRVFNFSETRLARVLLRLGRGAEKSGDQPLAAAVSQTALAEMVGTTRARVSHFMNGFRMKGVVRYGHHGGLHIDRARLIAILQR